MDDDRPFPDLASTYALYDNDDLEAFVDAAIELLDEYLDLNRYHTIQLLTLIANSAESPEDTATYYHEANREYQLPIANRDMGESAAAALYDLGATLLKVRELVFPNIVNSIRKEDIGPPLSLVAPRSGLGFDSTAETVPPGFEGPIEEGKTEGKCGEASLEDKGVEKNEDMGQLTLTSRPKPSKFEGTLKRRGLTTNTSKADIRKFQSGLGGNNDS